MFILFEKSEQLTGYEITVNENLMEISIDVKGEKKWMKVTYRSRRP